MNAFSGWPRERVLGAGLTAVLNQTAVTISKVPDPAISSTLTVSADLVDQPDLVPSNRYQ